MLAKKVSFGLGALLMLGMLLMGIWNRASLSGAGGEVPLWLSIPFAGLLLCIALCPPRGGRAISPWRWHSGRWPFSSPML